MLVREAEHRNDAMEKVSHRLRSILGDHKNMADEQLLNETEEAIDELKIRREEVISYKAQISQLQSQSEQDRNYLQGKI
jgi:hypothetical protein